MVCGAAPPEACAAGLWSPLGYEPSCRGCTICSGGQVQKHACVHYTDTVCGDDDDNGPWPPLPLPATTTTAAPAPTAAAAAAAAAPAMSWGDVHRWLDVGRVRVRAVQHVHGVQRRDATDGLGLHAIQRHAV